MLWTVLKTKRFIAANKLGRTRKKYEVEYISRMIEDENNGDKSTDFGQFDVYQFV
jgi:hypothetical protein